MSQVKIKDYSNWTPCYKCDGTGLLPCEEKIHSTRCESWGRKKTCDVCKGSGKYKNERYLLSAVTPQGQTIAFEVDDRGK